MNNQMRFRAIKNDSANSKWSRISREMWPAYKAWYLKEGLDSRPSLVECEDALQEYMPELIPVWKELSGSNSDELFSRMLTLFRPPAYIFGCSQAVWISDEPFLIRNYDYSPALAEGVILHTNWNGTKVMGMSDCLWGLVDGINEHGLAVSLTFGGRKETGEGFGIPLILRYVLQVAKTVAEAIEVLSRVPTHMSYNIMALDSSGDHAMIAIAPDRLPVVTDNKLSTNHQRQDDWPDYAARTQTLERAKFISDQLADNQQTPENFVQRFSEDPLYQEDFEQSFGTLYTAIYRPKSGQADFVWPGFFSSQTIDSFHEGEVLAMYGDTQIDVAEISYPVEGQTEVPAASSSDWNNFVVHIPQEWQKFVTPFLQR